MTAANTGGKTPEDDDPFGYLYEDGHAAGATSPSGRGRGYGYPGPAAQPGVPRTSYNHVRAVGERQYGGPNQTYGQQIPHQQGPQQGYPQGPGQPTAQYAAPETYPGGVPPRAAPPQSGGRGSGGRGPNTKALLIGAVTVVAVVVIGITVAVLDKDEKEPPRSNPAGQVQEKDSDASGKPEERPSPTAETKAGPPKRDAATLQLGGPAKLGTEIKGAKGVNGAYVMFNGLGGSASWSVEVPADGAYTLHMTYSVPGKDAETSLTVNNGDPRKINMSNFAKAGGGEWEKGWTNTYSYVNLKKGKNDLKMSCEQGNSCDVLLDQVRLETGTKG
ncbi:carbohydrate-binding protein [Streptomyces sp. CAU 1734]|uniref:carbohydrate-binding protein n=1 Tax=Streptomyces sp. CAU 1734 TaxID=3140360 RepID=UPI003261491A